MKIPTDEAISAPVKIASLQRTYFTSSKKHKSDQRLLLNYGHLILKRGRVRKMDLRRDGALIHFANLPVKSQPALSPCSSLRSANEEQSAVTVTNQSQLSKQTFSWMLISLPRLLLLCLSSTSLYLCPALVLSPHLSATPGSRFLPPLPLFSFMLSSVMHLANTDAACTLLKASLQEASSITQLQSNQPLYQHTLCSHISYQHIKETASMVQMKSIVAVTTLIHIYLLIFLPLCACVIVSRHARRYVHVILPHVHLCLHDKSPSLP